MVIVPAGLSPDRWREKTRRKCDVGERRGRGDNAGGVLSYRSYRGHNRLQR